MISPSHLAWLQLRSSPGRLRLAILGVAFAVLLMFMQFGFLDSLYRSVAVLHRNLDADIVLVSRQFSTFALPSYFPRRRLYQAMGYPGVDSMSYLVTSAANWRNPWNGSVFRMMLIGVDPSRPALTLQGAAEGMSLLHLADVALFDTKSRNDFGPVPQVMTGGQTLDVEVNRHELQVRGLFELGPSFGIDGSLLLSEATLRKVVPIIPDGGVSVGLLRLAPGVDPVTLKNAIATALGRDVQVLTRDEFIALEVNHWATSTPIGFIFSFGALMGMVVGVIIIYQILFADISDHLGEYATLKAMGYSNRWLLAMVVTQSTILTLLGYPLGMLCAWGLFRWTHAATSLPMVMDIHRPSVVLILSLLMGWASAGLAIRKLYRIDPAEVCL